MSEFKTGKNQQQVYLMFKVYPKIQRYTCKLIITFTC